MNAIFRYFLRGFDLNDCDYDNRTALHLAAAEGQVKVIAFLLGKVRVSHSPVDRYISTPRFYQLIFICATVCKIWNDSFG
jgi:glutaminase